MRSVYIFRHIIAGLIVMLAGQFAAQSALSAQEVIPQTSPELRDFKLDPEKPKPAPKPLPQDNEPSAPPEQAAPPVRTAPAPVQRPAPNPSPRPALTLPEAALDTQRRSADPAPQRKAAETLRPAAAAPVENAVPSAESEITPTPVTPAQEAASPPEPLPGDIAEPSSAPNTDVIEQVDETQQPTAYWWIAIAAAAFVGALALFLRRRKSTPIADEEIESTAAYTGHQPGPLSEPDTSETEAPKPLPIPAPAPQHAEEALSAMAAKPTPAKPARKTKRPELELSFIPEKATLSLAKLTIKGQIRIINGGNAEAKSMSMRAAIISANAQQDEQISAFHSVPDMHSDEIGAATIGERIAMDIDLIIPISELSHYPMGNMQLFAPIVVVHIDYTWGGGASVKKDIAKISCIIGRESTPPKPKMAPLRLDLGPRSFTPLGQRPVFA